MVEISQNKYSGTHENIKVTMDQNMLPIKHYFTRISPISNATWNQVKSLMKEKIYEKGEFFAKVGRVENKFGVVLEGVLRAYISRINGSQYTKTLFTPIHFKTPISFVGALSSLVTGTVNQVSIEALTPVKILEGNYKDWKELITKNQEISEWSRKLIELFFMGKEQREFEFFNHQADKRYKLFRERYPELENLINQYYIAQFIGVTPVQLSRIRKKIFAED